MVASFFLGAAEKNVEGQREVTVFCRDLMESMIVILGVFWTEEGGGAILDFPLLKQATRWGRLKLEPKIPNGRVTMQRPDTFVRPPQFWSPCLCP